MISSIRPYALASSGVNQRSRSESRVICSKDWPLWKAISSDIRFLVRSSCSAWIRMSVAEPPRPAEGWCIRMLAFGSEKRLPLAPAVSRNWPIDAAMPIAMVTTSFLMYCMVS